MSMNLSILDLLKTQIAMQKTGRIGQDGTIGISRILYSWFAINLSGCGGQCPTMESITYSFVLYLQHGRDMQTINDAKLLKGVEQQIELMKNFGEGRTGGVSVTVHRLKIDASQITDI